MATELLSPPDVAAEAPVSAASPACSHCGLPVPAGLVEPGAAEQFCCHGCRTAYEVIRGCGLDRYYALRERTGAEGAPARGTGQRYGEFDDPVFQRLYCREVEVAGEGGAKCLATELRLEGVHCAACVWLVERLGRVAPGVIESRLDMRRALVRIVWDPGVTSLSRIARALDALGYPPHPARDASAREIRRAEDRRQLIRLAVAGACAGNVMLLALALYAGVFEAMEPAYAHLFRWTSMVISLVSLAWPGSVFFRGAVAALRTRTVHLDVPIALGLAAGALWSVIGTVRGTGEVYFDSLSVLVFAMLVGRFIQHRQQRWASDAVELLFSLTPTRARVVGEDGQVREAPIEAVARGDVVEVLAGESVPADGRVERGRSSIDQSLLTGESVPVAVREGDAVIAGAVNLSERILVRVEATGEETRVGRLMRMVEENARRRAPIVRAADRIAGWFVLGMIGLAAVTVGVWLWIEPSRALENAAALLIVTCPCALGLATPLAVTVALGRAARRQILVKGGDALERLARPGTIFLDKTGTVTEGRMRLVRWVGAEWVKPLAASVESVSSHPVARAIVAGLSDTPPAAPGSATETTGGGVDGRIGMWVVRIGSPRFVREAGVEEDEWVARAEAEIVGEGMTPVLVAVNDRVEAVAGLGDPVREDAAAAVAQLRARGWRVAMLSGDHPDVARAVGRRIGLDAAEARGGMTPEAKLEAVREELARGSVVMVGDGVNDAAALAAATVGVAVHGGAEASLSAAAVYLNRPGLMPIVELVEGSRRTLGVIRRNLGVSLVYNAVSATLAVVGLINPLIAAVLMPASSLTVLTLSFRSRTFGSGRDAVVEGGR